MTARDVSTRLLMAVGLFAAGCYDVPKPDCGFRCGSSTECPDGYTCASDGRCHRDGADPALDCPTVDAGTGGYSPRIVASMPMPGDVIDRTAPLYVFFDVDVAGLSESSFLVVMRSTQTQIDGLVSYDPFAKRASLFVLGALPPSQQFDLILTSDIYDPRTSNVLMELPIGFATLPDTTPPEVDAVTPTNGEVEVPVSADVFVRFDEQVTGVTGSTVNLSDTAVLPANVSYSTSQRAASLVPTNQLEPHTTYTVSVGNGIADESGNLLVPFTSTFTTGDDFVLPNVRFTSPAPGMANVAVGSNVVVTFDEVVTNVSTANFQLNNGAIAGTITQTNANRTITFDPATNLPAASTITVSLGSTITDTSGNPLPMTTFNFSTQ